MNRYTIDKAKELYWAAEELPENIAYGGYFQFSFNDKRWSTCRETSFGYAREDWYGEGKLLKPVRKTFPLYILYSVTPTGVATKESCASVAAQTLHRMSAALYEAEKLLKIAGHKMTVVHRQLGNNCYQPPQKSLKNVKIKVRYDLSNKWRYSPAMLFLMMGVLRDAQRHGVDAAVRAFTNNTIVIALRQHGREKIFGKQTMLKQINSGKRYSNYEGALHFQQNVLPHRLTEISRKAKKPLKDVKKV